MYISNVYQGIKMTISRNYSYRKKIKQRNNIRANIDPEKMLYYNIKGSEYKMYIKVSK